MATRTRSTQEPVEATEDVPEVVPPTVIGAPEVDGKTRDD